MLNNLKYASVFILWDARRSIALAEVNTSYTNLHETKLRKSLPDPSNWPSDGIYSSSMTLGAQDATQLCTIQWSMCAPSKSMLDRLADNVLWLLVDDSMYVRCDYLQEHANGVWWLRCRSLWSSGIQRLMFHVRVWVCKYIVWQPECAYVWSEHTLGYRHWTAIP